MKKSSSRKPAKKTPARKPVAKSVKPAAKASAKSAAKPAAKAVAPAKAASKNGSLTFTFDPRKEALEHLLGAAYLMMDRAWARLGGDKDKSLTIELTPKKDRSAKALAQLEADFVAELSSQRLRWAVARNNQPVREYVAEHALTLAEEYKKRTEAAAAAAASSSAAPGEAPADQLTAEQKSEIERLIAEVELEISAMNKTAEHKDPEGRTLSWEAANEKEKEKA